MEGCKILRDRLLRVYILEGRVPRGAAMVGAERKIFETLKSLDRRKWHFQTERKLIQAGKKSNCEKKSLWRKIEFQNSIED